MEHHIYAGFWVRLAAMIVDVLIIMIPVSLVLTMIYGTSFWLEQKNTYSFWSILLNYVLPVIFTIFFWRKFLGTPGKMLFGLRVVDKKTGGPLTFSQCIIRYISYIVSAIPFMLGFVWIAIDQQGQSFHDKIAGAVVVRDLDAYTTQLNH